MVLRALSPVEAAEVGDKGLAVATATPKEGAYQLTCGVDLDHTKWVVLVLRAGRSECRGIGVHWGGDNA